MSSQLIVYIGEVCGRRIFMRIPLSVDLTQTPLWTSPLFNRILLIFRKLNWFVVIRPVVKFRMQVHPYSVWEFDASGCRIRKKFVKTSCANVSVRHLFPNRKPIKTPSVCMVNCVWCRYRVSLVHRTLERPLEEIESGEISAFYNYINIPVYSHILKQRFNVYWNNFFHYSISSFWYA